MLRTLVTLPFIPVIYVTRLFSALLKALFSLLPYKLRLYLLFNRDLNLSYIRLLFGRLFPELVIPQYDLTGKNAIVTGSNSGIGLQIATELAQRKATVYLAIRNKRVYQDTLNHILWRAPESRGRVHCLPLDTSSQESVRDFCLQWAELPNHKVDILFHNAGISSEPSTGGFTPDDVPVHYATNLLGSFLLTHFLEPYFANDARVLFTSSTGHYGALFSKTFSLDPLRGVVEEGFHRPSRSLRRFNLQSKTDPHLHRTAQVFAPGWTKTAIFSKIRNATSGPPTLRSDPIFYTVTATDWPATEVDQGAATGVWLASAPISEINAVQDGMGRSGGGGYWDRLTRLSGLVDGMLTTQGWTEEDLERFWSRWEADVGIEWR